MNKSGVKKVALFQHTKLNIGAGEERAILNYAKNLQDRDFELTIYQTDYCPISNLTDDEISSYVGNIKLVTLSSIFSKFRFEEFELLSAKSYTRLISKLFYLFLKVAIFSVYSKVANNKLTRDVKKYDLIYIYDSEYIGLIPHTGNNVKIVGCLRRDFKDGSSKFEQSWVDQLAETMVEFTYKYLTRRFDAFHFLSDRLFKNSKVHRNKDFVQNSGTDLSMFYPDLSKKGGNLKFLFVGRLEPIKGVVETVESFERLDGEAIELHIVGTGPLSDFALNKSKGNSKIFYEGYMTKEKLAEMYRKCDILVFPTKMSEQHPLVVVEAIASGLLVLTSTYLEGIFDYFESLGYLEYINVETQSFSERMRFYADKKEELRILSKKISKAAVEYDWSNITENLFRRLIDIAVS